MLLRAQKVVGKFVEFYGEGAASLPVPDRATIGNMSPSTVPRWVFFRWEPRVSYYLRATGTHEEVALLSKLFFVPRRCLACREKAKLITASISIWIWRTCSRASLDRRGLKTGLILPELGESFANSLKNRCTTGGYGKKTGRSRESMSSIEWSAAAQRRDFSTTIPRRIRESNPASHVTARDG